MSVLEVGRTEAKRSSGSPPEGVYSKTGKPEHAGAASLNVFDEQRLDPAYQYVRVAGFARIRAVSILKSGDSNYDSSHKRLG